MNGVMPGNDLIGIYGGIYGNTAAAARPAGRGGGFAAMMAQTAQGAAAPAAGRTDVADVSAAGAVSLEGMLKAKYPGLAYHVLDQSTPWWRTRTDYPHYLLYQEGEAAERALQSWKPVGENPLYGSTDGRFTAPKELYALGALPPGSKAVAIHPKVQQRMEEDPEYAREIYERIDTWFAFDVARNEAILPGCTWNMSQAVAIGEDGSIVNACSSSPGGGLTSSRGEGDGPSWWERRKKRSAELMELRVAAQLERAMAYAGALAGAGREKARLAEMLARGDLRQVLGDTVGDLPIENFLTMVSKESGIML